MCFENFKGTETPLSAVTNAHTWIAFQVERLYKNIFSKTFVYDLVSSVIGRDSFGTITRTETLRCSETESFEDY